jgi:glycosyltransferase involved in cell wall biosynthesis
MTGPHLWNVPLVRALAAPGRRIIHTIHDLDAHRGTRLGSLLGTWNRAIIRAADHIVVHGRRYRERLIAGGLPAGQVTYLPLLHLFTGYEATQALAESTGDVTYEPFALLFGRIGPYKGLDVLLRALCLGHPAGPAGEGRPRAIIAGPGKRPRVAAGAAAAVEWRDRVIGDDEAIDLFRRAGLVVLPYTDATQSALVAAGYYFRKPVVVADSGALPEYVEHGTTGLIVRPGDAAGLEEALALMQDESALRAMGEAGRLWYDAQRGQENINLEEMYRAGIR